MRYLALPCLILLLFCACGEKQNKETDTKAQEQHVFVPPAQGTVIAADSQRIHQADIAEDLYFSVKVIASDRVKYGTYHVKAEWGYNVAKDAFTLPEGGEYLTPVLRKGDDMYSYIIGFRYGKDSTFYDYYLVRAQRGMIEMKYIKAYAFR